MRDQKAGWRQSALEFRLVTRPYANGLSTDRFAVAIGNVLYSASSLNRVPARRTRIPVAFDWHAFPNLQHDRAQHPAAGRRTRDARPRRGDHAGGRARRNPARRPCGRQGHRPPRPPLGAAARVIVRIDSSGYRAGLSPQVLNFALSDGGWAGAVDVG